LNAQVLGTETCPGYRQYHVRFRSEPDDFVYAFLLVPDDLRPPSPTVIAVHTSASAGKDCTVGRTGLRPGEPPDRNMAYALDAVERGYVVLAPDMDTLGERAADGRVFDTNLFYRRHPDWSAMGKAAWDLSRCVDYLETRPEVDPTRIACMGHCFGAYTTLFGTAFEPRIRCALTNAGIWTFRSGRRAWARNPEDPAMLASVRRTWGERAGVYVHIPGLAEYVGMGQDELLKPLPLDYHDIACLVAPRGLCLTTPLEGRPADLSDTPAQDLRFARNATGRFLGALESVYAAHGAEDRMESWVYESNHDWKPEAKARAFAFMERVFAEPEWNYIENFVEN
jgi:hypothetical protein